MTHGSLDHNYEIESILSQMQPKKSTYFTQIIDLSYGHTFTSYMIPFFSLQVPDYYIQSVIDIIKRCGGVSQKFYPLISHLMHNIELNYDIYLRFYDLLSELSNSNPGFNSYPLLRSIILNLELWFVCPQKELIRIVDHWHQVLYQVPEDSP